ncbi:MAG: hypothetical protein DAHOPDDO_01867 [Ignavibacteriaceae bacterium]|nr:hypothetical protein [Ignavibacteriaceae bacterium]
MKKKIFSLCLSLLVFSSTLTFAQGPGEPYNPMTANGARGIWLGHKLNWENPPTTVYNKIYFSEDFELVNSLDSSALLYDGYPSTVYSNIFLAIVGNLNNYTKYYWKVVEYNSITYTTGPTWYFITRTLYSFDETFDNGLNDWQIIGPSGILNWSIANSSNAGGNTPELQFLWTPSFIGNSYIMYNQEFDGFITYAFDHFVDWYANPFTVGFGITTDSGNSWITIWEISPQGNVGPSTVNGSLNAILNEYRIGFYFIGNSYNIDCWYLDDVQIGNLLTPPYPPSYLETISDTSQLRVFLNWNPGWCVTYLADEYEIKRKDGLPLDTSSYTLIASINGGNLNFIDENVFPNETYTYRIRALCGGSRTIWGNEATAYVPNIVPVELQSFSAEIIGSDVNLLWSTATETNNSGFDVEKKALSFGEGLGEAWKTIGFVPGFGTTTEVHHYLFVDERLQAGNYQYRLKQIDFDGTFEYSNIIEVTIDAPIEFSLEQNFPNPFNPTTKIKYTIPASLNPSKGGTLVQLQVFDILGNAVATLINEQKQPGTYEVEFNGTGLPSGIYFYKLKAGTFVQTKKMILIK